MIYHAIEIKEPRTVKCGQRTMMGTGLSSLDRRVATEDVEDLRVPKTPSLLAPDRIVYPRSEMIALMS